MYVGVDGYKAPYDEASRSFRFEWAVVTLDDQGHMTFQRVPDLQAFWDANGSRIKKMLIDEPLGLQKSGRRECDAAARRYLGKAGSSVFDAPAWGTLDLWGCALANGVFLPHQDPDLQQMQRYSMGHGLSLFTYGIFRYIHEARQFVIRNARGNVFGEAHPEVCFMRCNGDLPLLTAKKNHDGKFHRIRILQQVFPNFLACAGNPANWSGYAGLDDILDAAILAITARDIHLHGGSTFPALSSIQVDPDGIPISIEYF